MDDFDYVIRLLRCIEDDLEKLHLRLQALEQNTTTARPAEQKPVNPDVMGMIDNALIADMLKFTVPPIRQPREYWLIAGVIFTDMAKAYAKSRELLEPQPAPIHVREVL